MAQTQLVPEYEGKVGENCYLDALEMNYSETGGRQKWHYKGDIFVNKVYGGNNKMFWLKQSKYFEKNVHVPGTACDEQYVVTHNKKPTKSWVWNSKKIFF